MLNISYSGNSVIIHLVFRLYAPATFKSYKVNVSSLHLCVIFIVARWQRIRVHDVICWHIVMLFMCLDVVRVHYKYLVIIKVYIKFSLNTVPVSY